MDEKLLADKKKRVKKELGRLDKIFAVIPDEKKIAVQGLIQNAAFMRVELEDVQVLVQEMGAVEAYQNGKDQLGMKPSAAVNVYNQTLKSYNVAIKTLLSCIPDTEKKKTKDELADFLTKA